MSGMPLWLLLLLTGAAAGTVLAYWILSRQRTGEVAALRQQVEEKRREGEGCQREIAGLKTRLEERSRAEEEKKSLLQAERKQAEEERKQLLESARETFGAQFRELAGKALEEKSKALDREGRKVLEPFQQQMKVYQERLEQVHKASEEKAVSLKTHIEQLMQATAGIGQDAKDLTLALKGDSQQRGSWGEVVLRKMLEESGLREGHDYEMQRSMQDEEGGRSRPDAILHLPDGRDVVIDSKVPLLAWERAAAAEDEAQRRLACKEHVAAIRAYVRAQGKRRYQDLPGLRTLDFVFLFIPIEPAFMAALHDAPEIYQEAYEQSIVLTSPTTLYAILRVVENIWRLERQNQNAAEIARQGGGMYDKVVGFLESFKGIQKHLEQAQRSWEQAKGQLHSGQGSLLSRAEKMRELGAKTSKLLPMQEFAGEDTAAHDEDAAEPGPHAEIAAIPDGDEQDAVPSTQERE